MNNKHLLKLKKLILVVFGKLLLVCSSMICNVSCSLYNGCMNDLVKMPGTDNTKIVYEVEGNLYFISWSYPYNKLNLLKQIKQ